MTCLGLLSVFVYFALIYAQVSSNDQSSLSHLCQCITFTVKAVSPLLCSKINQNTNGLKYDFFIYQHINNNVEIQYQNPI